MLRWPAGSTVAAEVKTSGGALKRFGYEAKITTAAEFETFFAAELRKWPPILTASGLKPQ